MSQREHGGRLRGFAGLVLAAIIGVSACAGPAESAGPSVAGASAGSVVVSAAATPTVSPSAPNPSGLPATSTSVDPSPSSAATTSTDPQSPTDSPTTADPGPTTTPPLTLPDSQPVSLSVPAIGVTSPLSSLGRNPDGTVQVPSLDDPNAGAGWFRDSPEPGSLGPAIILGHVDSRQYGPGVFYDLKNMATGDTIEITRADGTVAVFTVDSVQDVAKAQFPTQQVYGNLDHAGLRLITCGGVFDSEARSYEDNIIVFASLTSSRAA